MEAGKMKEMMSTLGSSCSVQAQESLASIWNTAVLPLSAPTNINAMPAITGGMPAMFQVGGSHLKTVFPAGAPSSVGQGRRQGLRDAFTRIFGKESYASLVIMSDDEEQVLDMLERFARELAGLLYQEENRERERPWDTIQDRTPFTGWMQSSSVPSA